MNAEELEGRLEGRQTSRDIFESLAPLTGEQLVDDLLLALRGSPLALHFAQHLPLSELPVRTRSPWQYVVEDQLQIATAAERLVSVVPLMSTPLLRSRAAELVWWTLPEYRSELLADCLASTRLVAEVSPDPTDRLAAAWSGGEMAALTRNDEVLSALRRAAVNSAFQLAMNTYESDLAADFEMASGLMFLYGVIANWDSLPMAREISVICELADRRTRNRLPAGWSRGSAVWLHRLRYAAAQSDGERVRVVDEACAERRHAVATSPFPRGSSPPVMEAGELSRAIEDASLEAARLSGNRALREKMEQLTRDLVVDLQDLGWQVTAARTSLVSPNTVQLE